MSFEEPERVEGEHQEVQGEAVFRGYDLPPGQWFATRNGDLHRLHDSLWHRRDFVHDQLELGLVPREYFSTHTSTNQRIKRVTTNVPKIEQPKVTTLQ